MFYPVDILTGSGDGYPRWQGPNYGLGCGIPADDAAACYSHGDGKGEVSSLLDNGIGTGIGYTDGRGFGPPALRRRRT